MKVVESLEKRGVEYRQADPGEVLIQCPFHADNDPSCSVNTESGVFYCFSCKEAGNFTKLVARLDGVSYDVAKRRMLESEPEDDVLEDVFRALDEDDVEKETPLRYYSKKKFHSFFPSVLNTPGEEYLKGRRITEDTMKRFDLRWGVEGIMKDRVILPIYMSDGGLLSYAGRAIDPGKKPKTRKARSGLRTLYGMYELLETSYDRFPCIIVTEGEFDAMYLQQCGLKAVSTMGTAGITEQQLLQLYLHTDTVVWSYDGDDAGRSAQAKAIEKSKRFLKTDSVVLPDGKDPNELTDKEVQTIYGRFM